MAEAKPKSAVTKPQFSVVVYGLDEGGKPHAAAFTADEAGLAEKAAGLMGMQLLPLATDEQHELARGLPKGRIFASGRAFTPFIKTALYARLSAFGGHKPERPPAAEPAPPVAVENVPSAWAEVGQGSLVLISEGAQQGWFEAVVVEARPEDLFVLRWRDWPDEPPQVRRREHVALLTPAGAEAGAGAG